jgi:hypothetical protein
VRGEQDRQLELGQPLKLLPHRHTGLGIEPRRRLVEAQHLGAVDEPEPDVQSPLHAARVRADLAVGCIGKAEALQELVDPGPQRAAAEALTRPCSMRFSRPVASRSTPERCGT